MADPSNKPRHFVHISRKQTAKLAYTESAKKGAGDVQTPIGVREYLALFAPDMPEFDRDEILQRWNLMPESGELRFARTEDEILDFMARKDIPSSCMSGWSSGGSLQFKRDYNPYRVYAGLDLSVAYLESPDGRVIARTLVWEAKRLFGRIYVTGEGEAVFSQALRNAGFRKGSFKGARLHKIEHGNEYWVMPYLDNPTQYVRDESDYFVMTDSSAGDICCDNTCGAIPRRDEESYATCEHCDESIEDGDYSVRVNRSHTETWCRHCRDAHSFRCNGTDDDWSDEDCDRVNVDGDDYVRWYAERHFNICEKTDEWTSEDVKSVFVSRELTQWWSESAIEEHAFKYEGCFYDNDLISEALSFDESPRPWFFDERDSRFHAIPEQLETVLTRSVGEPVA